MNFQTNNPQEIHQIFDNTEYSSLPNSVDGTIALSAIISQKGHEDLKLYDNLGSFVRDFGQPNFRLHGQAIYNVIAHLNSGGKAYVKRIVDPKATYANILVKVGVKVVTPASYAINQASLEEASGKVKTSIVKASPMAAAIKKTVTFKVTTQNLTTLKSPDEIEAAVTAVSTDDAGFTTFPLFVITSKGRGKSANGSTFRLSKNVNEIADTGRVNYDVELMYDDNGRGTYETGGKFLTYLDPEYKKSGISYYLENMSKKYLEMHDIRVNEEAWYGIKALLEPVAADQGVGVESIDFLLQATTGQPAYVTFDATSVDLGKVTGIKLAGGVDGDWVGPLNYESMTGLKQALTKFYTGVTHPEILDKNIIPAEVMFDANLPVDVKNGMGGLVLNEKVRDDMHFYADLGMVKNETAAVEAKANLTFDNCNISIQGWSHKTFDPYTQRDIPVTGAWSIAAKLANHDRNFGKNRPMAGYDTGTLLGIVDDTLFPLPAGNANKAKLFDAKINYVEKIKGEYKIASQATTQMKKSDLELISNSRIKGEVIRTIMALVPQFKHNLAEPENLKTFKDLCELQMESLGKILKEPAKIILSQTQYQKDNRILQIEIRIIFKSVIEKIYVPIYIDKNVGEVTV